MTLHRARKPYLPAYARRQLENVEQALVGVRAAKVGSDWRKAATKAETLRSLEAQQRKWRNVLEPRRMEMFDLPF